jgi:hypothetical protein
LGDTDRSLRFCIGLWILWYLQSFYAEGRAWFAQSLCLAGAATSAWRALALSFAGHLAYCQADLATAEILVTEGVALAREHRDT